MTRDHGGDETITAREIGDLAALLDEVAPRRGEPVFASPGVPFAAPLLLFARLDRERREAIFADRPGRILVQEHLVIEATRRPAPDAPAAVRVRFFEPTSEETPLRIEADLCDPDGAVFASVRTALRSAEAASVAASLGMPLPRPSDAFAIRRTLTRALDAESVGRWLRLVGDPNPAHTDEGFAAGLGLTAPVVPGALLAAAAERLVGAVGGGVLHRLNMRFVAPIPIGAVVEVEIRERLASEEPGRRDVRLLFLAKDRVSALADLVYRGGDAA